MTLYSTVLPVVISIVSSSFFVIKVMQSGCEGQRAAYVITENLFLYIHGASAKLRLDRSIASRCLINAEKF